MNFDHLQKAAAAASALQAGPPDQLDAAQRAVWGMVIKEAARVMRKGSFKHGAESLRLLKDGTPWIITGKSQLLQDVWVLYETNYKREGFFVEFGGASGVALSNSWLLEKHFGWKGVIAEPNPQFRESLLANRDCQISFDCVYSRSGETVPFRCADVGEHSGITTTEGDGVIHVPTISLNDLLSRHNAPKVIDYMSIDTEGSELEILSTFDFAAWDVRLISVEHNGKAARQELFKLLTSHGYRRRFEELSHYDDWYTR